MKPIPHLLAAGLALAVTGCLHHPAQPSVQASQPIAGGYGRDIPLGTALSLLLPDTYTLDASGPDLNILVSYEGDRPWQQVATDLVVAQGYRILIEERRVRVTYRPTHPIFAITAGETLADVMTRWTGDEIGYRVRFAENTRAYPKSEPGSLWVMTDTTEIPGATLEEALTHLLDGFAGPTLAKATIAPNGQIRIEPEEIP